MPGSYEEATIGSLKAPDLPETPRLTKRDNRKASIQHYQAFLDESPENAFVPEAMRRLADLYLTEEQEALGEGQAEPGSTSRAAQLYAELLKRYPDHEHNDTALYQLARAHEQSGEPEPAMQALTRYAEQHSSQDKYDEAQFRRGEHLFVRRQFYEAEAAYQAVLDTGADSDFHQQALYKLGWARFKQHNYESALNAYISLLDEVLGSHESTELPKDLARVDQERLNDTLRAVSLSFSYLGDQKAIQGYFSSQGNKPYEPLLYARLASLHLSKERFSDAADTYGLFAESHPQHREAPLFQSRVIDVYKQAGFGARVLEEKQAFVERYQPVSNYWQQRDPEDSPDVMNQVQRHLRDVAEHYHAQAQQKKKPETYVEAGRWYRLYLDAFPTSKQTPHMNFLYAELLTSAGSHGEAALQYEYTAYNYGQHEKAAESGYAGLLAYRKHEATLDGKARADWHLASITSSLRFAADFPDHKQALPVRTLAAQQLYALKDYDGASTAAFPVIDNPRATSELKLSAWTVIAHARFDLHDYLQAEAAYQEVLARTPRKDNKRNALQEKLAASIYKQGEKERDAGNLSGAADHFLRITAIVPQSSINVTAQYDAAAAYIALKRWPDAIRILEGWRHDNPDNKLQADVTRKLAVLYRENSQPVRAAGEFERIAGSEKDPALRREAYLTTASLYQEAGLDDKSIGTYKRFIKEFPQPIEPAMEAQYQLVLLYGKSGQTNKQRYWQTQLVKTYSAAGKQQSERPRYLAAHARLALVADQQAAYRKVALKEPLKKNLATKKKYMQAAIKGYTEAAAYKIASVSTEATFQIGDIYRDFGKALMASERPRNLNEEELEQYEILLEEQAYPFEEKAIEVHETNAQRTADGLYDEWVRKSLVELAELVPVRYAKQEKGEDFVAVLQ
jgi:TolA-binding protein